MPPSLLEAAEALGSADESSTDADGPSGATSASGCGLNDIARASKIERRRARERESARRSRRRKKEQMDTLEQRVRQLQEENRQLQLRKAHRDLIVLNELYAHQINTLKQMVSSGLPDPMALQHTVGTAMKLANDRRVVVRNMLEDLQQILEPIYRTEAMWWIVEGIGKYDPDEELPITSPTAAGAPSGSRGSVRSILCERRGSRSATRAASAAASPEPQTGGEDTDGAPAPGDVPFRETLPPIGEGEGAKEIVRRVVKAMDVNRYQHMQAHLWISTHCNLLERCRGLYQEMKQAVHRLQQLRVEHEHGYADLLEALKTEIEPAISIPQYAQFMLFADKYAATVLQLVGIDPARMRSPIPPPSMVTAPRPPLPPPLPRGFLPAGGEALPSPGPSSAVLPPPPLDGPPPAKRARASEAPLPTVGGKLELPVGGETAAWPAAIAAPGAAEAWPNGAHVPPLVPKMEPVVFAPAPVSAPYPVQPSRPGEMPTIAEMLAQLRDVI
eukprot:tig00000881_g5232.t1